MEFREGNYFYKIDRTQEIHIPVEFAHKIAAQAYGKVNFVNANDIPACVEKHFECALPDVSGIDLSEKWLFKLGFIRDYYLENLGIDEKKEYSFGDEKTNKFIRICWHPKGGFTLSKWGTPISKPKYVHKLQNIVYEAYDIELRIKK